MSKEIINVRMFHGFELEYHDHIYHIDQLMRKQLINLLQIFFIYYDSLVTKEMLYELIWNDHDNPKSAMQYTIHQLRKELKKIFGETPFIITTKRGYILNSDYQIHTDVREFTELVSLLDNIPTFQTRHYQIAKKVFHLYKEHFYVSSSQFSFAQRLADQYCHDLVGVGGRSCAYLMNKNQYDEMVNLSRSLIMKEPFYESLQYYYIKGLIETKEYHRALKYYDEINESFYEKLGMGLSPRFKELYEIIEQEYDDEKYLLDGLKEKLNEKDNQNEIIDSNGYFCTFDLFRHIYHIILELSKRDQKKYYLVLIELVTKVDLNEKKHITEHLRNAILKSVRSSDICSQINKKQFILLVNCHKKDETYIIVDRICSLFYKMHSLKTYRLNYSVERLTGE